MIKISSKINRILYEKSNAVRRAFNAKLQIKNQILLKWDFLRNTKF
jgi:hypothetical protein